MENISNYPIYAKTYIAGRGDKRAIQIELKQNMPFLYKVETDFVVDLFDSDVDYETLYNRYCIKWTEACKKCKKKKTMPNKDYFAVKYRISESPYDMKLPDLTWMRDFFSNLDEKDLEGYFGVNEKGAEESTP